MIFFFMYKINIIKKKKIKNKKQKKATKKTRKSYQNLSEEEKQKSNNMVMNNIKPFLNMKSKGWFSIEEIVIKYGKTPYNNFQIYIKG